MKREVRVAVTIRRQDEIAVVSMDNPPVNALSVRSGFVDLLGWTLRHFENDRSVQAIVLHGEGRYFSAGADIADFGEDAEKDVAPIRALIDQLDGFRKPVIAAMHGLAFGGGLELALACHVRCCAPGTRFAFPEISLGLLPGAGGTQRLPRLVDIALAREMMLTGKDIDAARALASGLVEAIIEGDLVDGAIALARECVAKGGMPRRARDQNVRADSETATAGVKIRKGVAMAADAIGTCLDAARNQPFDQGLAIEHAAFNALMISEPARGLRHAFLLGRKLDRIPGLPDARRLIGTVAIVGAGTMGTGIATAILNAGLKVILIDREETSVCKAESRIRASMESAATRGRITPDEASTRMARLALASSPDAAAQADLLIEAVFEDLELKRGIFRAFDRVAKPDAILATNTSTLDVNRIAESVADPSRVVGLHFFSPAHVMKLLEIVRTSRTAPDILADAFAFARKIGKIGVVAGVCDGFIGNRIFEEYLRQAYFLLEEGALPADVDRALEAWGLAMGPLKVMDLAGQDIGWNIRKRRAIEQPDRPYSKIPDLLCEMGRFGQKTGAGYYLYPDGKGTPVVDPEIEALCIAHSASLGITRVTISDEEIVTRCLFAMINEGARILEEGIALRPLDIDAVYLHGYGFPDWRGGPMFHADQIGIANIVAEIGRLAKGRHGWAWAPSPLLQRLAETGARFASLND